MPVEYWDLTDADGIPTGETIRRGAESWPEDRFHVVATVCVVRPSPEVLVTLRSATKSLPLTWEFPGGSVLAGETGLEGAGRELREETGVDVSLSELRLIGRVVESRALVDLYVAQVADDVSIEVDPVEVAEHRWVPPDEAHRLLTEAETPTPWRGRLGTLWAGLADAVTAP